MLELNLILKNDYCGLYRICLSLDTMISKLSKRKRKQRLLKAVKRLRKRSAL